MGLYPFKRNFMSMNKYVVRPAVDQDFQFCLNLHHKAYKVYVSVIWGWDEELQNKMFQDTFVTTGTWIVSLGEQDIGYYQLNEKVDNLHIRNFIIDQNYQGIGIGTSILKDLIETCKTKNQVIKLGVFKMNQRAMKLYRRLGFKVVEESETHYMMKYELQKGQER
ncbi:MAG: hypothetical protein A2381_14440 [Bdellovibrionales bacterium RIFOXYB1_FULL_37_110]|nr:MAG: hypothetical protein A2381_14440 [Bdellovibrionales bacterium RIFOXYB1_FULL_37_110]OFZ63781.1 MAG: hypothetical protein A2577_07540 [Bdellovibrionales bacterium RIFOXYD1_FULL_36_51]